MKNVLLIVIVALWNCCAVAQESMGVSFVAADEDKTEVRIGGELFTVLNHGADWKKPFFFPMNAADGTNVLRDIIATKAEQGSSKEGTDHFHHKGVWIAVDSVNDEKLNYWHEDDAIVNQKIARRVEQSSASLILENDWMQGPKALLKERSTVTFHPNRLVVFQIELSAVDKDVTFYDTKEGFLATRIAHSMRQMQGGTITNSLGDSTEKECWGKECPWVDYSGEVNGQTYGVTLMDHPENFRKSRYHVRGYGLFSISPFGPKKYSNGAQPEAPVTVKPGDQPLVMTYGLYVHNQNADAANLADVYQKFLSVTAKN